MTTLPLAPQGVFLTVQGEGRLSGLPMVFVRLAGCVVNCEDCDTDYSVAEHAAVEEIARRVVSSSTAATGWVWVTGGEPTAHDLRPLLGRLHGLGYRVALATAGVSAVQRGTRLDVVAGVRDRGFDFVSVSPHRLDDSWQQRTGDQVNLVFGLNGLTPADAEPHESALREGFTECYVTPCDGRPGTLRQCLDWVHGHRGWRLGSQAHKHWGLP